MTTPLEIANPQLYKRSVSLEGEVGYVPVESVTLTKQEKAWAGFIIGIVGTAVLVIAGFVPDPKIQAMLYALGALINTVGIKLGVFQVANSTSTS